MCNFTLINIKLILGLKLCAFNISKRFNIIFTKNSEKSGEKKKS